MPINPEPDAEWGNINVTTDGWMTRSYVDSEAREIRAAGGELYLSHFATCPKANQHRRSG